MPARLSAGIRRKWPAPPPCGTTCSGFCPGARLPPPVRHPRSRLHAVHGGHPASASDRLHLRKPAKRTDGACRMLTDIPHAGRVGGARGPPRIARRAKAASVTDSPLHARSRRPRGPSRPGSGGGPRFAGHRPVAVWRRQAPPGGVALARLKSTLPADRHRRFNRPASRGARAPASRRARIRGACPRPGNSPGRTPGRRRRNEGERP